MLCIYNIGKEHKTDPPTKWFIAEINGIGYQPLICQVLKRFTDSEKRRILREKSAEMRALGDDNHNDPDNREGTRAYG